MNKLEMMNSHMSACVVALALSLVGVVAQAQTVEYIHTDALGTPIAVTDANRVLIERSEYEPYGKLLNRPLTDGPGFTGHVQDAATGMTYMQQRYYDPGIGRFLSVDPVTAYDRGDMRFFNRYVYAFNNPYAFTDPDGRATCANKDCSKSYIDAKPIAKAGPPAVNGGEGISESAARSQSIRLGSVGPKITFQNDNPTGASTDRAVTTATAKMVEATVLRSGVKSVNINSTTGGHAGTASRHNSGKAVDINRVNGLRVDSAAGAALANSIQGVAAQQLNVRENFGPAYTVKTVEPGSQPITINNAALTRSHQNHVHLSGQE